MSSGRRTSVARPAQYTGARRSTPSDPEGLGEGGDRPTRHVQAGAAQQPGEGDRHAVHARHRARLGGRAGATPASGTPLDGRPDHLADARRPQPLLVLAVLEDGAEGDVDGVLVELGPPERGQGRRPSRSSRPRRAACTAPCPRITSTAAATWRARPVGDLGARRRTMATSRSKLGMLDPVVQAAPLEGVVHVAGAVGGDDHDRRPVGGARNVPSSGTVTA